MSQEKYQPTPEEIKQAEETMTDEQKVQSKARAEGYLAKEVADEREKYDEVEPLFGEYSVATVWPASSSFYPNYKGSFEEASSAIFPLQYIVNGKFERVVGPVSDLGKLDDDHVAFQEVQHNGHAFMDEKPRDYIYNKNMEKIGGPYFDVLQHSAGRFKVLTSLNPKEYKILDSEGKEIEE